MLLEGESSGRSTAGSAGSETIQGRGLARRRVRPDQRPQDDDRQHRPGRRDHGRRLPDVPAPGRGRAGRARIDRSRRPSDDRTEWRRRRWCRARVQPSAAGGLAERDEPPLLERDDWLDSLRTTQGQEPGVAPVEAPLQAVASPEAARTNARLRSPKPSPRRRLPASSGFARLAALWGSVAPGRERILTSPLVIGLVASLAILVGMGFWLKSIIASTIASRTFNHGVQNFDDGDYRTAIRDFDSFLIANPEDLAPARRRCCGRWPTSGSTSRPKGAPGRRRWRPPARWSSRSASCRSFATSRSTWPS